MHSLKTEKQSALARLKAASKRPGIRIGLRIAGIVVLTTGAVWAIASLDLSWSDLWPSTRSLRRMSPNFCRSRGARWSGEVRW